MMCADHPVILCTDDSGVFGTSLSKEYAIAARAFSLDKLNLLGLARGALEHCMVPEADKEMLNEVYDEWLRSMDMNKIIRECCPCHHLALQT